MAGTKMSFSGAAALLGGVCSDPLCDYVADEHEVLANNRWRLDKNRKEHLDEALSKTTVNVA